MVFPNHLHQYDVNLWFCFRMQILLSTSNGKLSKTTKFLLFAFNKFGIWHKTFVNKAAFPSHVFKRTSLPRKLTQNVYNKNGRCCDKGSHSGSFYLHHKGLVSKSEQTKCNKHSHVNLHTDACVWERNRVRCFWEWLNQIILMTDFSSGISEQ